MRLVVIFTLSALILTLICSVTRAESVHNSLNLPIDMFAPVTVPAISQIQNVPGGRLAKQAQAPAYTAPATVPAISQVQNVPSERMAKQLQAPAATAPTASSAIASDASCEGPAGLPPRGTLHAAPENPGRKICENGRIRVIAGAVRHFGHRIMDLVHVTVYIESAPGIDFDLSSLQNGVLDFDGQEFDFASPEALSPGESPVTVTAGQMENGNNMLQIDLILQSSVPPSVTPYVVFRMDLLYSSGFITDAEGVPTESREWRTLTTPDAAITLSATAMTGDQMLDASGDLVPLPKPWPMYPLLVAGVFLAGLWPGLLIVRYINRVRPGRKIPPKELAWRQVSRAIADGRRYGFQEAHYRDITVAIRTCFKLSSAALMEARELLHGHEQAEDIIFVLVLCDDVLYKRRELTGEEIELLMAKIKAILTPSN